MLLNNAVDVSVYKTLTCRWNTGSQYKKQKLIKVQYEVGLILLFVVTNLENETSIENKLIIIQ